MKARRAAIGLAALLLLGTSGWFLLRRPARPPIAARLSVAAALGGAAEAGFARALAPRPFAFPADHGPHPAFRTEWWYFTGNLEAAGGRRFGYQLTFFRNALAPRAAPRPSRWAARQVFLAHFAVTDPAGRRFLAGERFRREALGLAGARGAPFRVWLDRWSAASEASAHAGAAATVRHEGETAPSTARDGTFPLRLRAATGEVALDLTLARGKPPVLQGERGLSRKGSAPGQASYYYSLTRLPTAGRLRLGRHAWTVRGDSWMDREWSTSSLPPGQVGWDWFALQLADGRELMLYRLRLRGGGVDPASGGALVARDGTATILGREDAAVEALATWESPAGGRYPSRWRVRVPAAGLDLTVRPLLADQEHRSAFRYWEGAVDAAGTSRGAPLRGRGYVELTGYAEGPTQRSGGKRVQ
jgi:predicted secreted hydrolase